jgi:F-type H+-transporting ATPase subunit b
MQSPFLFGSIGSDMSQIGLDTAKRFGVDLPHFAAQCVSFIIVAFLLQRYAYKPILIMLEERKKRIKEGLDNAEQIKQELANTQTKTHEIMVKAGQEATRMIEEARAAAAKVQEQETQKAIAAAQDIVDKARQATQAEHARMLADLRREVGRLVVDTTRKVTGKVLTTDDQKRLAEETSRELAA